MLHVAFILFVSYFFSSGHCSREMGDAGEDVVHRSCWNHQVIPAVKWHDAFFIYFFYFCTFSLPVIIHAESGRPRRGPRDKPTQKRMVIISLSFFSFDNSVLGSVQYRSYCIICNASPQALESLPCWNERYTKTALLWWSSFALLWDVTLWSFLQVKHLCNV